MSCHNCDGTVWYDHAEGQWKHAPPWTNCKRPEPRRVEVQDVAVKGDIL